jgi:hypothetical protein
MGLEQENTNLTNGTNAHEWQSIDVVQTGIVGRVWAAGGAADPIVLIRALRLIRPIRVPLS